jgi:hypothetical protein
MIVKLPLCPASCATWDCEAIWVNTVPGGGYHDQVAQRPDLVESALLLISSPAPPEQARPET